MGRGGQKLDLLCILNHLFVVLINLFYQLNLLFPLCDEFEVVSESEKYN